MIKDKGISLSWKVALAAGNPDSLFGCGYVPVIGRQTPERDKKTDNT